jgi:hypothetical protein
MFIEMKVAGITIDPLSNTPIVILKDSEGSNALPIWIGILEASAIATELGDVKPPRPMTHDLIKNIFESLNIEVIRIEVTDLRDNTFFATIYVSTVNKNFAIDARPSDAIALALRTNSPIFVNKKVIEESSRSINLNKEGKGEAGAQDESQKWEEILENLSPEDFGKYKM